MDTLDLSELWEAQIGGRIELLTLDQLDAAFESGRISETTLVRAKGTDAWSTLATIAGLDAAPIAAAPQPVSPPTPQPFSQPPPPSMPNSVAPVVADVRAPYSHPALAQQPLPSPYAAPSLDIDLDAPPTFGTSKKKVALGIAAAIVAVLGLGAGITLASGDGPDTTTAAASSPAPAEGLPPPKAEAQAEPKDRLSDEQRRALMEADKKREATQKPKHDSAHAPSGGHTTGGRPAKGGTVFSKGGNQYDPLNSNL